MTKTRFAQSKNNLLCASTQSFILQHGIVIETVGFSVEHYEDRLYQQLGINPPHGIESWVTKRKAEFLAGRLAAKKALQQLGVDETDVRVGEHRAPIWPQACTGSITHTHNIALAAVTLEKKATLGIDLEDPMPEAMEKSLFISQKEQVIMDSMHSVNKKLLPTAVFSAKESFFKAAYSSVKRYFDFDAIALEKITESTLCFRIQPSLVELYRDDPNRNSVDIHYAQINTQQEKPSIFTMVVLPNDSSILR